MNKNQNGTIFAPSPHLIPSIKATFNVLCSISNDNTMVTHDQISNTLTILVIFLCNT